MRRDSHAQNARQCLLPLYTLFMCSSALDEALGRKCGTHKYEEACVHQWTGRGSQDDEGMEISETQKTDGVN